MSEREELIVRDKESENPLPTHSGYLEERFVDEEGGIIHRYVPLFSPKVGSEEFYVCYSSKSPLPRSEGDISIGVINQYEEFIHLEPLACFVEGRSRIYDKPEEDRHFSTRVFSDPEDVEALDVLLQAQIEERDEIWMIRPPRRFVWTGEWRYQPETMRGTSSAALPGLDE